MKQILRLCLIIFLLAIAQRNLSAQNLTPTAHFKFDESIHETYSGLIPDTFANSFNYGSDELNATNAAIYITGQPLVLNDPAFTQFGVQDFSMSLWFKRTASLWPARWLITKNSGSGYFRFRYNGFFDQMAFYFRPNMDSSELVMGAASQTVGNDNWNLYTMTLDRDDVMKLYLNGNLVSTQDISHVVLDSANFTGGNLVIGSYDCAMNDLLFFDKALDSNEVLALFNHQLDIDKAQINDFIIYPNPVVSVLKIKSKSPINGTYTLFSSSGVQVQKGTVMNNEIEVGSLSAGKYILWMDERSFSVVIN